MNQKFDFPEDVIRSKAVYVSDLVISVSESFSDELLTTIPYFRNLSKSYDELFELMYPIISSFMLYKCVEYISRALINSEALQKELWQICVAHFVKTLKLDPMDIINEYKDLSENNSYMREMFLGDKICKICGGTFSNRYLVDDITVKYLFFFNKFVVPALGRIWL